MKKLAIENLVREIAIIEDLLCRMRRLKLNSAQVDFYNRKCETLGQYKNMLETLVQTESEATHV